MGRRSLVAAAVSVALVLSVAHWLFWYAARERGGTPAPGTAPGRVFLASELPLRLWLPRPHQNLAELEEGLGDIEPLLRSLAELSGRPVPRLPAFGTFRVPPAHELVLASDPSGERFMLAARIYPVAGFLSRWAGRLASNPLLAGGRAEIDGRPVEVEWSEGTWIVRSTGLASDAGLGASERAADGAAPLPEESGSDALAWFRMARRHGRIPPGEYTLRRDRGDLVLEGGDAATLRRFAQLRQRSVPMPLLMAETYVLKDRFAARLLGLLPGSRSIAGLPGATAVSLGPRRWRLPGEGLLELAGDGPPKVRVEGWRVVALDEESLARGEAVVELGRSLDALPPLGVALWLELGEAERLVDQVVGVLEEVPVIGRRKARRWRAGWQVLAHLSGYRRLTAFATDEPAALSARLEAASGAEN